METEGADEQKKCDIHQACDSSVHQGFRYVDEMIAAADKNIKSVWCNEETVTCFTLIHELNLYHIIISLLYDNNTHYIINLCHISKIMRP